MSTPHSYEVPRNPSCRAEWLDYTAPRARPDGTRLAIVLSNSQGYMVGHGEAHTLWPGQLEDRLAAETGGPWIVANWSHLAVTAPELVTLAARASEHTPDLVIALVAGEHFQNTKFWPPLRESADPFGEAQIAATPATRAALPPDFRAEYAQLTPGDWLFFRSNAVRLGRRLFYPILWEPCPNANLHPMAKRRAPDCDQPPRHDGLALLRTMEEALHRGDPTAELLVVGSPICRPEAGCPRHEALAPAARDLLADRPATRFVDAIDAVPCELFYDRAHLQPDGHAALADFLTPHALEIVGPADGAR